MYIYFNKDKEIITTEFTTSSLKFHVMTIIR